MNEFVLSTNDFRSERSESEWNNDAATSLFMNLVVNEFSNTIRAYKNILVRIVLIYCFSLHIISIILTEKHPYRRHICLVSYPTILYTLPNIEKKAWKAYLEGLLCKSSEQNGRAIMLY